MKNLPKLLFTQAASKWKLILMNSHVSLQMGPRYKTIRTEPALVLEERDGEILFRALVKLIQENTFVFLYKDGGVLLFKLLVLLGRILEGGLSFLRLNLLG